MAIEPTTASVTCPRCRDTRVIWSQTLDRAVRCPRCTTVEPRNDPDALRQLTAAQARRLARISEQAAAFDAIIRAGQALPELDPFYEPTNRVMQRWAVGQGDGLPNPERDPVSRPPPLDDATQVVVDRIVLQSPSSLQKFVRQWYCSPIPVKVMASERGMSYKGLISTWEAGLAFLRVQFLHSKHADLITLVIVRI